MNMNLAVVSWNYHGCSVEFAAEFSRLTFYISNYPVGNRPHTRSTEIVILFGSYGNMMLHSIENHVISLVVDVL